MYKKEVKKAAGRTLWWELCTPINTVLLYARGEIDKIAKHPNAQRHQGKKYLKQALAEVEKYSTRLYNSGDYKVYSMFSLDGKIEVERDWYRPDVTSHELFDYWRTIGCEGYKEILPFYTCLENKIRQMIVNFGGNYHPEVAGLANVSYLCTSFDYMLTQSIHQLKVQSGVDIANDFAHYSMRPLLHACDALGRAVYGSARIMFDDTMANNIAFGLRDVMDRWSNYLVPLRNAMAITPEFRDLFRTRGYMLKQIDDYAKMVSEIEEAAIKQKKLK